MALRRTVARSLIAAPLVVSMLAACSSSKPAASTTTEASTTTTSTPGGSAPTTATAVTPPPRSTAGCTSGPGTPPAGAQTKRVADVDGDGRPDTAWMSKPDPSTGAVTFGISTAAGGGATTVFNSASPVERSALVVNADERGPVEIILSDGRSARLDAFQGCGIHPVLNPQGQGYTFDLGERVGTGSGIGCLQTPAGRRLVGLDAKPSADGSTVTWTRTVIELNGLTAHNGAATTGIYHLPADQSKIAVLNDISCGSLTIHGDGVSSGP